MGEEMSCYGKYNSDDRICQMCSLVNKKVFNNCKELADAKIKECLEIEEIANTCPYRIRCCCEYEEHYSCLIKNGKDLGRCSNDCYPKKSCLQFRYDRSKNKEESGN